MSHTTSFGLIVASLIAIPLALTLASPSADAARKGRIRSVTVGGDLSSRANAFIQPQDPALAGGDRDQTQQQSDALVGGSRDDLQIGGIGVDVLIGDKGNDVLIGGPEHFNPNNRDKAFGGPGSDIFIWAPGDGSDLFDGGRGRDVVIFGLLGEQEGGETVFRVSTDQQTAPLVLDETTRLPQVDVTGSPGFCEVIDPSTSGDAAARLAELGADRLVRFVIRGIRGAFDAGDQDTDNGLRVTLTLRSVETLVCTDPAGGGIVAFDLRTTPPTPIAFERLPKRVRQIVR